MSTDGKETTVFDEVRYNVVQSSKLEAHEFVNWILENDPDGFLDSPDSEILFIMKKKWVKHERIDWRVTAEEVIRLRNELRWQKNR